MRHSGNAIRDENKHIDYMITSKNTLSVLIGKFLREKLMADHGHFLPTRATRSGERARFVWSFS